MTFNYLLLLQPIPLGGLFQRHVKHYIKFFSELGSVDLFFTSSVSLSYDSLHLIHHYVRNKQHLLCPYHITLCM